VRIKFSNFIKIPVRLAPRQTGLSGDQTALDSLPRGDSLINNKQLKKDLSLLPGVVNFTEFESGIDSALDPVKHKKIIVWQELLQSLPSWKAETSGFRNDTITLNNSDSRSSGQKQCLKDTLMQLHPWRKGPYNMFDVFIDTEWRSDWKWNRIKAALPDLANMCVLDVGSGNGYHCWRAFGEGANLVLGIDPYLLSVVQFQAIRHFTDKLPVHVLPFSFEEFPDIGQQFGLVFSMGVIYHRRSPPGSSIPAKNFYRTWWIPYSGIPGG